MAPSGPPISRGFRFSLSYSNWVLYFPGEISVNKVGHYGHLDYLVPGNRKNMTEKMYDILEI